MKFKPSQLAAARALIEESRNRPADPGPEDPHGPSGRICADCGQPMTAAEAHFYEVRCEGCESEDLARYQAWRHGAEDPELDTLYDEPPPVLH